MCAGGPVGPAFSRLGSHRARVSYPSESEPPPAARPARVLEPGRRAVDEGAMASWVVGDVHGCADELAQLIEELALGPDDRLVSCGDLFHRGPDPAGVMDLLTAHDAAFVLGNHERVVLRHMELVGACARGARGPEATAPESGAGPEDLAGDGGVRMCIAADRCADLVRFLHRSAGYRVGNDAIETAGPTPDGRDWVVVHAGIDPSVGPRATPTDWLVGVRRIGSKRRRSWWYESWNGPELVLFGHTPSPLPRAHYARGRLVALGLDTGCVYGGRLTAYSPELDEYASVEARRAYVSR